MEAQRAPSLVKIATKYGLIDGVLAFIAFVIFTMAGVIGGWSSSLVSLAILVVLMVLAHRELKKSREGIMTYAQGLGSGTLLAVVGSLVACVLLYIYVSFINPGYPALALQAQRVAMEQRGLTGAQLEQGVAMAGAMLTPTGILISSLVAGVIMGFICALIVSIFTRASDPRAVY